MPEKNPKLIFGEPLAEEERVCVLRCSALGSFEVRPGDAVSIGRSPDNQIVAKGTGVSRVHAKIDWPARAPRPQISDSGSANGTLLDGEPVAAASVLLPLQGSLEIGPFVFEVEVATWGGKALIDEADEDDETTLFSEWQSLSGTLLDAFSIHEVLRKLEAAKATGTLKLEIPQGDAAITLGLGRIMAATAPQLLDLEALDAILAARRGRFSFAPELEPCESVLDICFTSYERAQRKSERRDKLTKRHRRQQAEEAAEAAAAAAEEAEEAAEAAAAAAEAARSQSAVLAWIVCPPFEPIGIGSQPCFTLGRSGACDLTLPHISVCATHAVISREGDELMIEDRSLYGTILNGTRIMLSSVRPGDRLTLGPYDLTIEETPRREGVRTQPLQVVTPSKTKGGRLERVSLRAILEHFGSGQATGELKVVSKDLGLDGTISVERGRTVHAQLGVADGIESVHAMLQLDRGRFEFKPKKKIKLKTMSVAMEDLV